MSAVEKLELLAEQGDADAQCNLGILYRSGKGVQKDHAMAVKWFRRASAQGHAEAQYQLGAISLEGPGTLEDRVADYLKELRKAAGMGHLDAQTMLARLYESGCDEVHQDLAEAAKWYRMAAEQGDVRAQERLSDMSASGREVAQDSGDAVRRRSMADAEIGHPGAQPDLAVEKSKSIPAADKRIGKRILFIDRNYWKGVDSDSVPIQELHANRPYIASQAVLRHLREFYEVRKGFDLDEKVIRMLQSSHKDQQCSYDVLVTHIPYSTVPPITYEATLDLIKRVKEMFKILIVAYSGMDNRIAGSFQQYGIDRFVHKTGDYRLDPPLVRAALKELLGE